MGPDLDTVFVPGCILLLALLSVLVPVYAIGSEPVARVTPAFPSRLWIQVGARAALHLPPLYHLL